MKHLLLIGTATAAMFSMNAHAISWTLSPDANAIAFGETVVTGVNEINFLENDIQPAGIYGAGFTMTSESIQVDFDADLYTWDSYNANTGTGTGYWDAFIVTISSQDYYWNLGLTDPVTADASTFVWGGTTYGDGNLESYSTAPYTYDSVMAASDTPTTWYVSVVLDTETRPDTDTQYPSWGSFHVAAVPVPAAVWLFGSGLLGLVGIARRRA